jgi:hypothetical protein
METVKTSEAFKKGLVELDKNVAIAKQAFDAFLNGAIAAIGVPKGYSLNPKSLDFDPPKIDVEDKPV